MSYREYFNIDPEYFPQVDKKLIEEKPDLWKKFWPHPTFVQLLKAMVDVLERKQKLRLLKSAIVFLQRTQPSQTPSVHG